MTTCQTCKRLSAGACASAQGLKDACPCECHKRLTLEDLGWPRSPRRWGRTQRLQSAADAGFDTWEDFRGER